MHQSSAIDQKQSCLQKAILEGPGPRTKKDSALLFLKGCAMGTADIIPGVSGGTVAFVTGIYSNLIAAISSIDANFLKQLLTGKLFQAISIVHTRFLLPLSLGIACAIIIMARPMHYFIVHHQIHTWSIFLGLIAASILVMGKQIEKFYVPRNLITIILGAVLAYTLIGVIPVQTPNNALIIFFTGAIGATAMILPGISGAFILLLLGKYEYITQCIRNPFVVENFMTIIIFSLGFFTGLISFSKLLKFLLKKHQQYILCLLTGFMIGAMRKIWPWKSVIQEKIIRGKTYVLQEANVLPPEYNSSFFWAIALAILGFAIVLLIDSLSTNKIEEI
ncbi:DUF368 domain-containing protein [Bacteriovoracaceae bacterium]|nr:DUF368 domain-containing protein [Bacteriovoracaceae bacterium]